MGCETNEPTPAAADIQGQFTRRTNKAAHWVLAQLIALPVAAALRGSNTNPGSIGFWLFLAAALAPPLAIFFLVRCPACGKGFMWLWLFSYGLLPRQCSQCGIGLKSEKGEKEKWRGNRYAYWFLILPLLAGINLVVMLAAIRFQLSFELQTSLNRYLAGLVTVLWLWSGWKKGHFGGKK